MLCGKCQDGITSELPLPPLLKPLPSLPDCVCAGWTVSVWLLDTNVKFKTRSTFHHCYCIPSPSFLFCPSAHLNSVPTEEVKCTFPLLGE